MTLRKRITLVLLPFLIVSVFLINYSFAVFFQTYLQKQEDISADAAFKSLVSFVEAQNSKYLGTANDWGGWTETYDFVLSGGNTYAADNLTPSTFNNLDINFFIIASEDASMMLWRYFDLDNQKFKELPAGFVGDFAGLIKTAYTKKDLSGVFKLGGEHYFISATTVTDNEMLKWTKAKLLVGRKIDSNVIADMEKAADGRIAVVKAESDEQLGAYIAAAMKGSISKDPFYKKTFNKDKTEYILNVVLPNRYNAGEPAVFSLAKTRGMYLAGLREVYSYGIRSAAVMLVVMILIFYLLGKYITKPFEQLMQDVKNIKLSQNEISRIAEGGAGEFSFLRSAINAMLQKIDSEQNMVRENREKLYATLVSVGDGVIAADADKKVEFLNPVAQKLTGWSDKEAFGQPLEEVFKIVSEYTRERVDNPVNKVLVQGEAVEMTNHTLLIARDGAERPIEDTAAPIKDIEGNIVGFVLVFRDFSERKEKLRRIEYLSYHDQLTGLYNRRFFEDELHRLDKPENLPMSFIYADVNGLKSINDAFGHEAGDRLIQAVGEAFKESCPSSGVVARTGGDEFIIMLPKTPNEAVAQIIGNIKKTLSNAKIMDISISISFGDSTKTESSERAEDVLKNAENNMYQKKIYSYSTKRSAIVKAILSSLFLRSDFEEQHSKNVADYCERIGKAFDMSYDDVKELAAAGELHDIGKIAIDQQILKKTGELSEADKAQIRCHPETGYRLLCTTAEYYKVAEIIFEHHERWDGQGYPKGLRGENISWKARAVAIAEAYDVMTNPNSYRGKALTAAEAAAQLRADAGSKFDPEITDVFIKKVLSIEEEDQRQNES